MTMTNIQLIGIAGGTCSGKSTLLKNLVAKLGDSIASFSFDEYFVGSDLYDLETITNFEDPKLYDFKKFVEDLKRLKLGESLNIRANSRESSSAGIIKKVVESRPIILVEGFLIFYEKAARDLFDKKVFLELPDAEILRRRFGRTKGTKHWDSRDYIQNKIIPYHHLYVEPQKEFADLIIDGLKSQKEMMAEAMDFIQRY